MKIYVHNIINIYVLNMIKLSSNELQILRSYAFTTVNKINRVGNIYFFYYLDGSIASLEKNHFMNRTLGDKCEIAMMFANSIDYLLSISKLPIKAYYGAQLILFDKRVQDNLK